ncbi:MAG: type II toxin-antitoxin system VapC family toxin [Candidatus Bathyarchaeia archaeon]|jgi:predicted nucleic acid-binding protein
MRFVDANVFIYQIMQSPQEDYEISERILQRIERGEEAAISLSIIQEVIKWLEYNHRKKEIGNFLIAINSYISINKVSVAWENFLPSLEVMNKKQISFVDSLTLQIMSEYKINEIYSSDKDFDRIDWVKRIWE